MKRTDYYPGIEHEVRTHEESMLEKYKAISEKYTERFKQLGCEVELTLFWYNEKNHEVFRVRPELFVGYKSAVSCEINKNGKMVCVNPEDNSALSASWGVCSITNRIGFFNLFHPKMNVTFYTDTSDAAEDIDQLLALLKEYPEVDNNWQ